MESRDYLSGKQYKIEGVYGLKILPNGDILRRESIFTQYLNSEAGVILWLREQTPFKELQVFDLVTRKDVTREIINKACGVK